MANAFKQGEHICTIFETADEQLATAVEYLADGLRQGERCLYVGQSAAAVDKFKHGLRGVGLDPDAQVARGALLLSTSADAHLATGRFDSERMLQLLNEEVETALTDGFAGLRTCGDMSWLLDQPLGSEQIVEYEALLNQFFQSVRGSGMCQYDSRRLPPHLIDHALATHTSVIAERRHKDNPFYRPPALAMSRRAQPNDVKWKLGELRRRAH